MRERRRSVKFADSPPEIVRFSYSSPGWTAIFPSASTSSIGSSHLKIAEPEPFIPVIVTRPSNLKHKQWNTRDGFGHEKKKVHIWSSCENLHQYAIGYERFENGCDVKKGLNQGRAELNEHVNSDDENDDDSEMARHVAECIDELNNGLHRVLQARQMV